MFKNNKKTEITEFNLQSKLLLDPKKFQTYLQIPGHAEVIGFEQMPNIGRNLIIVKEKDKSYFCGVSKSSSRRIDIMNYQHTKNFCLSLQKMSENRIFLITKAQKILGDQKNCLEIDRLTMLVIENHEGIDMVKISQSDPNYVELATKGHKLVKIINCHKLCLKCNRKSKVCVENTDFKAIYKEIQHMQQRQDREIKFLNEQVIFDKGRLVKVSVVQKTAEECNHEIQITKWEPQEGHHLHRKHEVYMISGKKFYNDEISEYPKDYLMILLTTNFIVFKVDAKIFYY